MIESFKLTKEFIQFESRVKTWEDAIVLSSAPLLEKGYVSQEYVDAMIESVHEHGPYIVIAPQIALPHARPEAGSINVGFSILKLDEPVAFSEEKEHQVRLLIALSCVDATTHMELLTNIVTVLSDEEKNKQVFDAVSCEELLAIFS